jgi:hypothetical protein
MVHLQTPDLAPTQSSNVPAFDRLRNFLSRLIARIDLTNFAGSCCGEFNSATRIYFGRPSTPN